MRIGRLLFGMLVGNAVGAGLCLLLRWGMSALASSGWAVTLPNLALIPFCVGFTAAWFWRSLNLRIWSVLWHSLTCSLLGLGVGAVVFREGWICLIILFPILYCGTLAGALAGRLLFRKDWNKLNIWVAPMLAVAALAEPAVRTPHSSVVTDELTIAAPPSKVWPHVLAFGPIPEPPLYWLFRIGLPYPMETTNGGNFVGADRSCEFSGGAVFREKVAEIDPERRLTFDMVEMPADPELIGHLDARRGRFELRDNGNGTTTLVGSTWYSLHVRPAWYFDWWTHRIFRAVHLRVMGNIKVLAEKEGARAESSNFQHPNSRE